LLYPAKLGTEDAEMLNFLSIPSSFVFEFAKALVYQNGPDVTGFAVKYTYGWGKGYL
jgi:hypothetical protein